MMGSKLMCVNLLFLMFVFLENYYCSEGCWEEERLALFKIKNFFNDPASLTNWVDGDENSDCCQWERVTCNNITGRVKELYLYGTRNLKLGEWYLNASLFNPFKELEFLDLSDNKIAGCIENEGFERLSRLSNLKILYLYLNLFNNSILSSLQDLSSLRILELFDNKLKGTINVKDLGPLNKLERLGMSYNEIEKFVVPKGLQTLTSLKTLDVSDNQLKEINQLTGLSKLEHLNLSRSIFNHSILSSIKGLSSLRTLNLWKIGFKGTFDMEELDSLSNLEELYLSDNMIDKFVISRDYKGLKKLNTLDLSGVGINDRSILLQSIGSLFPSLKKLYVGDNNLTGLKFSQGLCELVHLETLDISNNDIGGSLPWCLANMTSLQELDISYNQLTGNISSSPLIHLTSFQELTLSSNLFQIPISLEPFFNHSNLKWFDCYDNQFYAEAESHSLAPKFQLNYIYLSGYLNGGTFPKFLYHQHDLLVIDLSHLNLTGEFPSWLLENNTNLERIILVNNSLLGPIQLPSNSHKQLKELNISRNALNGGIPSSFGNMNSLEILDLSNNQLTGGIPEHLAMGCFSLQLLVLSNNNLQGRIFSKSFNLTNLLRLQLDDNQFIGEVPECLSNSSLLEGLYLRNNNLYSRIPRWLGNMSYLEDIVLSNNHLNGPIPAEVCQLTSLKILDFSENNLFGSLPSCFNPSSIKQVHLSKNMLEGQIEYGTFYNSSSLVTLDLSYNYLNGSIPKWINKLSSLSYLLFANNNLEGEIPVQLCLLKELRLIDLSHNHLSGQIPHCLDNTSLHKVYYTPTTPIRSYFFPYAGPSMAEEIIRFTTKEISYYYRGRPLKSLFGVDLSCNNLTGQIPLQIGYLMMIRSLNLSYNNLSGSIPLTFSNLKQVESLDLSNNKLSGKIPSQLVELNTLAVFNVAYNKLSGKIPEWIAQFSTFDTSSYEGNPLLCGLPLPKCYNEEMPKTSTSKEEYDSLIDMESFFITFAVSYVVVLFGFITVLYVNPYWRQKWFYLVEQWMT